MTAEMLSSIVAVLLSLAASYLPRFSGWYQGLEGGSKRLLMLALLAVSALGVYGLACAGLSESLGLGVSCNLSGGLALLRIFLAALISNQAAFAISPRSRAVQYAPQVDG